MSFLLAGLHFRFGSRGGREGGGTSIWISVACFPPGFYFMGYLFCHCFTLYTIILVPRISGGGGGGGGVG